MSEWQTKELKFTKVRDVKSPTRAHPSDCAIDFYVPNDFQAVRMEIGHDILIPSGIKVRIPDGFCLLASNKSGIATKKGLVVGAELIDTEYLGEIHIHLAKVTRSRDTSLDNDIIKPGDKIVQFILMPINYAQPLEISNEEYDALGETERNAGGFGSTGQ
jgi:dUTP pyrophosphatase